jgi:hypothetical protein
LHPSTNTLNKIIFANSTFVAVGNAGTILTSSDGATWTSVASGTTKNLRAVCAAQQTSANSTPLTFRIRKFTGTPPSDMVEVNKFIISLCSNTTTITYDSNIKIDGVDTTGARIAFNIDGTTWYKLKEPVRFIIVC